VTIGPFLIGAPSALLALLALPLLWWLMRATPPPPQRAEFPPTRLLEGLRTDDQARERAPWWLLLLRVAATALLILAFARPSLAPQAAGVEAQGGRTLIVIDDGWTSAPFWAEVRATAISAANQAERTGAPAFLLLTAPSDPVQDASVAMTAADAKARLGQIAPRPWRPDRADAAERLSRVEGRFDRILYVSDGLDDAGAATLIQALQARGPLTVQMPPQTVRALVAATVTPEGVNATVRRSPDGARVVAIAAETAEGRSLGAAEARFEGNQIDASALIALPPEIAARAARVRIVGEQSAGGTRLLAGGAARPFVGLVDPGGAGQPLLSELFYVERALGPYASLERGAINTLVNARAQALVLPDAARVAPTDRAALARWLDNGGLLIRFAGPRLAEDPDEFLPVRLRPGSRSLGSALAWEQQLALSPFAETSPFSGLVAPTDVTVRRQVLAEPASLAEASVWATLTDNSPLITARARGRGLIVLFHVSGAPEWSDLPLSGLFVEMLRRTLTFAARPDGAGEREIAGGPYIAQRLLDGHGALEPAPADVDPIPAELFSVAQASPATPPGVYERAGVSAAIDAATADEALAPLALPSDVSRAGLSGALEQPLSGWLFAAAALLLALDLFVALMLIGRLPRLARAAAGLMALALVTTGEARAQDDPTQALRLAYVRTGDARIDRTSEDGLRALTDMMIARTSVEPGAPVAVDLARDDLAAYPFLYWPAPATPRRLSDAALANLDRYLAVGGLLLVDTRDAGRSGGARPAATMLAGVDVPPLERVTADHVLARAFYLMRSFPGRTSSTQLWAESAAAASARDGVASIFIGDGDWATAWAGDVGDARQQELALRFGVNMVMVALTGNYKSDQVHVPALLERMGEQ
jgi:hypothetical protein